MGNFEHVSVLLKDSVERIMPSEKLLHQMHLEQENTFCFVDLTLGLAGHSTSVLHHFFQSQEYQDKSCLLIAFDRDSFAVSKSTEKLIQIQKKYGEEKFQFFIFNENFRYFEERIQEYKREQKIHAILGDFGVSSPQLDDAKRGFSFLKSGPLDMRMDMNQIQTAKSILEEYCLEELIRVFRDYGEEPKSKQIASCIVRDRQNHKLPLDDTLKFATYVAQNLRYPTYSRVHPATRIFQALRIEVNQELSSIENVLSAVPNMIHPMGKAAFISFHSLEDRLVKRAMRQWQHGKDKESSGKNFGLPLHFQLHLLQDKEIGFGKEVPRGGIVATQEETLQNPRARSARLRCFEFSKNI
jgi:16S rRNA (cytosine1402-N4)-methyltransferase